MKIQDEKMWTQNSNLMRTCPKNQEKTRTKLAMVKRTKMMITVTKMKKMGMMMTTEKMNDEKSYFIANTTMQVIIVRRPKRRVLNHHQQPQCQNPCPMTRIVQDNFAHKRTLTFYRE